jgi:serine/threonine protein phosphatase PrpC
MRQFKIPSCTAVVCLLDPSQKIVICGNTGDSRAILGQISKPGFEPLSRDQDPQNKLERARVKGAWGGKIDAEG